MAPRKKQLLEAALAYALAHGIAKLSLRPLAAELGTSPRMLMFYFKSKEGLLRELLAELHARLLVSFRKMASVEPRRPEPLLKRFWRWGSSEKNFPLLRLLYEAQVVAAQNPAEFGSYVKDASAAWQAATLEFLSPSLRSESMATLCVAVFDGLFLELMSTGERDRLTRALDRFIGLTAP